MSELIALAAHRVDASAKARPRYSARALPISRQAAEAHLDDALQAFVEVTRLRRLLRADAPGNALALAAAVTDVRNHLTDAALVLSAVSAGNTTDSPYALA